MSTRMGVLAVFNTHLPPFPMRSASPNEPTSNGLAALLVSTMVIRLGPQTYVALPKIATLLAGSLAKFTWPISFRKLGGGVPDPDTEITAEALRKPPAVMTSG